MPEPGSSEVAFFEPDKANLLPDTEQNRGGSDSTAQLITDFGVEKNPSLTPQAAQSLKKTTFGPPKPPTNQEWEHGRHQRRESQIQKILGSIQARYPDKDILKSNLETRLRQQLADLGDQQIPERGDYGIKIHNGGEYRADVLLKRLAGLTNPQNGNNTVYLPGSNFGPVNIDNWSPNNRTEYVRTNVKSGEWVNDKMVGIALQAILQPDKKMAVNYNVSPDGIFTGSKSPTKIPHVYYHEERSVAGTGSAFVAYSNREPSLNMLGIVLAPTSKTTRNRLL